MFLRTMEYPLNKEIKYDPEATAQLRKELRDKMPKKYLPEINPEMYEILKKAHRGGHTYCVTEDYKNDSEDL